MKDPVKKLRYQMRARTIRWRWTCVDHGVGALHAHRWRWTAWLCGRVQYLWWKVSAQDRQEQKP